MSDVDFRGNIRESVLTPNLMDNQWDYALPTDVKGDKIIDFRPQNTDSRGVHETYDPVSPAEFDRRKQVESGIYTILNDDLTRTLRVSGDVEDQTLQISDLDNVSAGGDTDWEAFSVSVTDSDVKRDQVDHVEGSGSLRFQADSTDSAVGIQNTAISVFDISDFKSHGSIFVDAKMTSGNANQLSVRLGSDSNNFYQITDSNQNDCTEFESGWNKIRLELSNRATTGTPVDTAMDYAAIFWSRDTTDTDVIATNDTDWHFDDLKIKRGQFYNLSYYSRFIWQDTAFALVENSTHDSFALLVQNDEYELILAKAAELASGYLRDREDQAYYAGQYEKMKAEYLMRNPSQAGILTTTYHSFASLDVDVSDSRDS